MEVSGLTQEVDARPSDAIALAVRAEAPIYVAATVMDAAAFVPTEEDEIEEINPGISNDSRKSKKPASKETKLAEMHDKLREAIEKEEYERAAIPVREADPSRAQAGVPRPCDRLTDAGSFSSSQAGSPRTRAPTSLAASSKQEPSLTSC